MDSSYRKSVEAENVSAFSPKKVKIRCGCRAQLNTADGVNLLWMHEGKWGGFTLQVRNSRLGIELGECNPKFCGQQAQLRNLLKWIPSDRFINGRKIRDVLNNDALWYEPPLFGEHEGVHQVVTAIRVRCVKCRMEHSLAAETLWAIWGSSRGVSQDAKLLPHNVMTYCNFSVFLLDVR